MHGLLQDTSEEEDLLTAALDVVKAVDDDEGPWEVHSVSSPPFLP